ncbi:MAG: hypothetical protein HUU07_13055, partial [Candidatus Brocadia sinica]|nr:hypothetical protein [Candidatus Brocadia sinica]
MNYPKGDVMKHTKHNRYHRRCLFPLFAGVLLSCLVLIISRGDVLAEGKATSKNITKTEKKSIDRPWTCHENAVNSVVFSPDAKMLASGNDNGIVIWDLMSMKSAGNPLIGHSGVVWSVAFSPDGKTLASGGADGTVILWDMA